jgi:hypothetical protein
MRAVPSILVPAVFSIAAGAHILNNEKNQITLA